MVDYFSEFGAFGMRSIGANVPSFDTSGFIAAVTRRLTKEARRQGEIVKRALEHVTENWSTPVDFTIKVDYVHDFFSVTVSTDSDIFRFVNDGTNIRYATMTKDFIPKTRPGSTISGRGRGGLAYVNKNMPRPGIEARNFIDSVAKTAEGFFYEDMNWVFTDTVEEFWNKAFR